MAVKMKNRNGSGVKNIVLLLDTQYGLVKIFKCHYCDDKNFWSMYHRLFVHHNMF